ncbi:unnamed protein product [Trypanosoma congolense IL3000]|nr:unnamed protein product [Trypanosoma congolense IL3000]
MLPRETLNCMPVNLTRFYRKYGHLFRVLDGDNEPVIQRSDLPIPEQRSLSDIGSEEILVLLYNNFPRRRHPKFGTCMERCINGLPRCARLRLRELDLVNDVLRQHPDKVELCGEQDVDLTKVGVVESHPGWLQVFRFVGGYQEELIRRYEALCLKHGQDPNTTTKIG